MTSVPSGVGAQAFFDTLAGLGPVFADRAVLSDAQASFTAQNHAELKRHRFYSAGVPADLGGGGLSYAELCRLVRTMAGDCPSTALSFSMHLHLLAATVWRHRRGLPGEALLRRIAAEELALVSTGGRDWLSSNGEAQAVPGGFRVTARKAFASGCEAGDVLVSSVCLDDPEGERSVLHFAVPLGSEGVQLLDDWHTLGMRGTGSRTVVLDGVFVPEGAVSLRRPAGRWHPVWATVLGVALPLIMSVYLGVAEQAARLARAQAARRPADPSVPYLLGELTNALTTADLTVQDMIARNDEYAFPAELAVADAMLVRKTIASKAALEVVHKAMEVCGGAGYFQGFGLEKLLRDVQAAPFHPLPEKAQHLFTGRLALGLEPVEG